MADPIIREFKTEHEAEFFISQFTFGTIFKTHYPHSNIWRVEVW